MSIQRHIDIKKAPKKVLNEQYFKELISKVFMSKTRDIVDMLDGSDSEKDTSLIEMAIARCAFSAYFEGDVKRLDWLLGKIGLKDLVGSNESYMDLAEVSNEAIILALKGI